MSKPSSQQSIPQRILRDRRIAYAVTDRNLRLLHVDGDGSLLGENLTDGDLVLSFAPELIGSEDVLSCILSGALPRYQLTWVNREMPDGRTLYLTITVLPIGVTAARLRV